MCIRDSWIPADLPRYFIAMAVTALYCEFMARKNRAPVTVYLVIAYIPPVPGGGAYYTMEHFVNGNMELFAQTGAHTLQVAGVLAMAIVLVASVMRLYSTVRHRRRRKKTDCIL